ncbi:MAG: hypothetical protein RSE94_05620 [Pseudomonas sp.]
MTKEIVLTNRAIDLFAMFLSCSFITGMTYAEKTMVWAVWFLVGVIGYLGTTGFALWLADAPVRALLRTWKLSSYPWSPSAINAALPNEVYLVEYAKARVPVLEQASSCAIVWVVAMLGILFSSTQPSSPDLKTVSMVLPCLGLVFGLIVAIWLNFIKNDQRNVAAQHWFCLDNCDPGQVKFPSHVQPGAVLCTTDLVLKRWGQQQTRLVLREDFNNPAVLFEPGNVLRKSIYWQFIHRF